MSDVTFATQRTVVTLVGVIALSTLLGLWLGSMASRRGGLWDGLLSRLLELSGALHLLIAVPLLQNLMSPASSTIAALGYYQGLRLARLCRNETRLVKRHEFVLAARALGLSTIKTTLSHVLPHAAPALTINVALTLPLVVSLEAALSFLGLDESPSWGALLVSASPSSIGTLFAVVVLTLLTHLAAEQASKRLLPHTIEAADSATLATAPDRSR